MLSHCNVIVIAIGQIIKSLSSFCLFVCDRSYGRNFYSILIKFHTVVCARKVGLNTLSLESKSDDLFPYFAPIFTPVMHFQ